MDNIEHRISQLELNQGRLALLLSSAPEEHKAWDKACLCHDLTLEQEYRARQEILDFLNSEATDSNELLSKVSHIVGHPAVARDLVSAFKQRGTAAQRWKEIDSENLL